MKDNSIEEDNVFYSSEKGVLPVNNPLEPCGKASDAENFRLEDEDGTCDDGVN